MIVRDLKKNKRKRLNHGGNVCSQNKKDQEGLQGSKKEVKGSPVNISQGLDLSLSISI